MVSRLLITLVALALLLSGCSRPAVTPPAEPSPPPVVEREPVSEPMPAQAPQPPVITPVSIAVGSLRRPFHEDMSVISGVNAVTIDEEGFDLFFSLPPETTREQAQAALRVTAPATPELTYSAQPSEFHVFMRFPAGKAGEGINVRLAGPLPGLTGELGFHLTRGPSPRVTVELSRNGGDWEPLTAIPVLSPQPLAFRFRLHGGAENFRARLQIERALEGVKHRVEQPAPDALVVTVPEPPPLLSFDFRGVPGEHGVIMNAGATVYVGEPPILALLDPTTGQEQVLMEAPADLLRGSVSPDGNWLLLSGMAPEQPWEDSVWLVNLQTKEMRLTGLRDEAYRSSPVVWLGDRLLLPWQGRLQSWHLPSGKTEMHRGVAQFWQTASPDGRYIVGYKIDYVREDQNWLAPVGLFIYDAQKGTEAALTDLMQYRVPHKGGYPSVRTIWEEDGRHILAQHMRWENNALAVGFVRVDVATGQTEPYTGPAPAPQRVEEWDPGPGGWQVRNYGPWAMVSLRAPDGTEQEYGPGLVVGWTAQGKLLLVRWNAEQRRQRMGE